MSAVPAETFWHICSLCQWSGYMINVWYLIPTCRFLQLTLDFFSIKPEPQSFLNFTLLFKPKYNQKRLTLL